VFSLVLLGVPGLAGLSAGPANAGTDDYPAMWKNAAPDTLVDSWGEYNRECTSFAAFRLSSRNGFTMPFHDDASGWGADAVSRGYTVNMTPDPGSIAWWSSGHVAWVESVSGSNVTVEEYNFNFTHNYSERTIAANSVSGYIHFKDLPPPSQLPASRHQFLADVNGDGKADAVVYYPGPGLAGNWYVALSTGSGFAAPSLWLPGTGAGSDRQFLADVNGDGKADAIMYWASTGTYYVALSTGSSFSGATQWSTGQIAGSDNQMMGDVNGDGKADAVVFSVGSGTWYASLSNGSGFTGFSQWTTGHGAGSTSQLLADVNGDGKADAVAFFGAPNGWWYVAPSTGSAFAGASAWALGHGSGSDNQILGDTTGDGKADALAYFGGGNGWWYVATSNGTTFNGASAWQTGYGVNSSNQLLGDVNGDGKADAIVYEGGNLGNWWVELSNGNAFGAPSEWMSGFGVGS
jgi:surface antigen